VSGAAPLSRCSKPYADYDPRPAASLFRSAGWSSFKLSLICKRCGGRFYGNAAFSRYCSDKCADAVRVEQKAAWMKRRAEDRAEDRQHYCDRCGEPMVAARSTKRFCSPRCRAAEHREKRR
jgi:endogenous inhibitor of DNA gyrase (YacG/DUF329 family)